jgi:predicted MFS family arabinose efflux permease
VVVVRDFSFAPDSGAATQLILVVSGVAIISGSLFTGQFQTKRDEMRVVVGPGEILAVQSLDGAADWQCSGYLLSQ